jgi:hypothetical protein
MVFPVMVYSQIGREIKTIEANGDYVQIIEQSYENVKIDRNGRPVIPQKTTDEYLYIMEGGYNIETRYYQISGKEKELEFRIAIDRDGAVINTAELYYYSHGKESLLRSHSAKAENGRIVSETIHNTRGEIGNCTYSYGAKNAAISYEVLELENINKIKTTFYTESDDQGTLFAAQVMGSDTLMKSKRIEIQGDTLKKSLLISKNRMTNKVDSVILIERSWFDAEQNLTMEMKEMIALTEPPEGEPKAMNFLSVFSYLDKDNARPNSSSLPEIEALYGAWRNEVNNLELFFEPFNNGAQRFYGSSYLLESNAPTPEEYLAKNRIWIYLLKQDFQHGSWSFDGDKTMTITLANGSILTFELSMDGNTLVLKPTMENMEGVLRFAKSN